MTTNHQIRLAAHPVGLPKPSDWTHTDEPVGDPAEGHVTVKVLVLSLDPAMRGWMNEGRSYVPGVKLGEVMRGLGGGRVVASKHPDFAVGDQVTGLFGVQEYATVDARMCTKVDTNLAPLSVWIGTLGMPGLTAYFGLLDIGKPEPGQTVVVSAASGAVGSVVGQIANLKGCRTVGIAGGPDKCKYLVDELGYTAAIDYKSADVRKALKDSCPKGIDVYFDNVGGDILDAALAVLARNARVVICGAISQYNATSAMKGPANYMSLLVNRASMTGMVVMDYMARYASATHEMASWYAAGKLKSREDIVEGGLANFNDALLKLFRGDNFGKLVLRVAAD